VCLAREGGLSASGGGPLLEADPRESVSGGDCFQVGSQGTIHAPGAALDDWDLRIGAKLARSAIDFQNQGDQGEEEAAFLPECDQSSHD